MVANLLKKPARKVLRNYLYCLGLVSLFTYMLADFTYHSNLVGQKHRLDSYGYKVSAALYIRIFHR